MEDEKEELGGKDLKIFTMNKRKERQNKRERGGTNSNLHWSQVGGVTLIE